MSEIASTVEKENNKLRVVRWEGLANLDEGVPAEVPAKYSAVSGQMAGTPAGCTLTLYAALDGETFIPMTDADATAVEFEVAGIKALPVDVHWLKPVVAAGEEGTLVDFFVYMRKSG